jgi:glycine/D-amino acid oxidase-like deaminating enzyme
MSLAFVVTLEKEIPELAAYAKGKTGKAIGRESDKLDSTARRKGVETISAMLSESQAALRAQLEADGFDPGKMRLPPELWFDAAQGLKTVRGVAEYVSANLNDFKQPNPILRDLKAAETLLAAAETAGVRFHFTKADL